MNRPKTIFCDIDGTLINHVGPCCEQSISETQYLLPNTTNAINLWDKLGYNIILTTGRKESLRKKTESILSKLGITYDKLIMGLGGGDRIIINDIEGNVREIGLRSTRVQKLDGRIVTIPNLMFTENPVEGPVYTFTLDSAFRIPSSNIIPPRSMRMFLQLYCNPNTYWSLENELEVDVAAAVILCFSVASK